MTLWSNKIFEEDMTRNKLLIGAAIASIIMGTTAVIIVFVLFINGLPQRESRTQSNSVPTVTPSITATPVESVSTPTPSSTPITSELVFKNPEIKKEMTVTTEQDVKDNQCDYSLAGTMFYYDEKNGEGLTVVPFSSVSGKPQELSYYDAVDYMLHKKDGITIDQGAPSVFTVSCGGAYFEFAKEISVTYPKTDAVRANYFMGGTQFAPATLDEVNTTISVYAKKGNAIFVISKSVKASLVFTDAETKHCFKSLDDTLTYDFKCLTKVVQTTPNFEQRLKYYAEKLILNFAIE